jgi:diguanylate cyclase (GGDEF)-like protein
MQINKIIKQAIKRLEREGKQLTPDFYAQAFCKEAKLAKVKIEDCEHVSKVLGMLSPEMQKELKNYRIQTLNELVRFLIAKINRANPTKCAQQLEAQIAFNKTILRAIRMLHNAKAKDLALKSLELLNGSPSKAQVEHFRQLWENFIANYDDTFLNKLKEFGEVYSDNLEKTIANLRITHKETQVDFNLEKIASALITSLTPSIASSATEDIEGLATSLQNNPEILVEDSFEEQIQQAIQARIALDKKSVKEMVSSLEGILDKLSIRLIGMIEKSDGSTGEIQRIKKELESFTKQSEINFQLAHKQLYTIATALEENTIEFKTDLEGHQEDVGSLKKKVKELEEELKRAKEEAKIDYLTKLYNKRALNEFLNLKEGEFKRYNRNYAIVMFDLDFFKKVNDTYGHEAGDTVLRAFGSILKKHSRDVDIVGRYGGEEFMAILSDTDKDGGVLYAQKVRKQVEKSKFLYKGKRIPITVSAGVAHRKDAISLENTIETADKNLYKAKKSGRNRVEK